MIFIDLIYINSNMEEFHLIIIQNLDYLDIYFIIKMKILYYL